MSAAMDSNTAHDFLQAIDRLVFVGFNRRVVALDRNNGDLVWQWKADKGSGFVAVLLDGDRLIVSVHGYTYCLHPLTGEQLWFNPLSGLGVGVPCLASSRGNTTPQLYAALAQYQQDQDAAAASAASSGAGT